MCCKFTLGAEHAAYFPQELIEGATLREPEPLFLTRFHTHFSFSFSYTVRNLTTFGPAPPLPCLISILYVFLPSLILLPTIP